MLRDMAGEGVAGVGNPSMPAPGDAKAEIQWYINTEIFNILIFNPKSLWKLFFNDRIKMLYFSLAESLSLLLRFCYGSKLSHALYDHFNLPIYYKYKYTKPIIRGKTNNTNKSQIDTFVVKISEF